MLTPSVLTRGRVGSLRERVFVLSVVGCWLGLWSFLFLCVCGWDGRVLVTGCHVRAVGAGSVGLGELLGLVTG